jgi:hypothetical protein
MNPYYEQQNEAGRLIYIKYQMDFPGDGDPYYIEENGLRGNYYSINAVPTMIGNATVYSSKSTLTSRLNAFDGTKSYLDVSFDSAYISATKNIYLEYSITSKLTTESTIQTVVFENVTYNNTGTNGETEFHHVVMKMLPDGEGNVFKFKKDSVYKFVYTYDMSSTFIERVHDLQMVVFVQNDKTKEIYVAAQREVDHDPVVTTPELSFVQQGDSVQVTLTCATEGATIHFTKTSTNPTASSPVYSAPFWITKTTTIKAIAVKSGMITSDMLQKEISPVVATPELSFVQQGDSVQITLTCATGGATIRFTKTSSTPTTSSPVYSAPFWITKTTTIKAIGIKSGMSNSELLQQTVTVNSTGNEEFSNAVSVKVYPNPATDEIIVESPANSTLLLYNSVGALVYEGVASGDKKLPVASMPSGIYVLKVVSDKGVATQKIIKK